MDVDKKIRLNRGYGLIGVFTLIPMLAWIPGYDFSGFSFWQDVALILAKMSAFGGMAMFALSLILSGRYAFYEKLFGGLDKMYIAHRFLGTASLALLAIHPVALMLVHLEYGFTRTLAYWFSPSHIDVFIGVVALYLLIGFVLWTIFIRSKYETFLRVHRLLGFVYILGALHAFWAGSVIGANDFMYVYLLVLTLLATITFILYSLLHDVLHKSLQYKVVKLNKHPDDVLEVVLKPKVRTLKFAPGQFVYVEFERIAANEFHPFSIASSNKSANLRLAIKQTGDMTKSLAKLKVGDTAKVKGPHGGFILELNAKKKQLWIAGGVGVTPFLSGAKSLKHTSRVMGGDIEMIFAANGKEPYGQETLQRIEDTNDIFNVTLYDKESFGHINFDALDDQITDLASREIYICGPPAMMDALAAEAEAAGYGHRLHYEEFSY